MSTPADQPAPGDVTAPVYIPHLEGVQGRDVADPVLASAQMGGLIESAEADLERRRQRYSRATGLEATPGVPYDPTRPELTLYTAAQQPYRRPSPSRRDGRPQPVILPEIRAVDLQRGAVMAQALDPTQVFAPPPPQRNLNSAPRRATRVRSKHLPRSLHTRPKRRLHRSWGAPKWLRQELHSHISLNGPQWRPRPSSRPHRTSSLSWRLGAIPKRRP